MSYLPNETPRPSIQQQMQSYGWARQQRHAASLPVEYVPLYVNKRESFIHPTPKSTSTALFTVIAPPLFSLETGVYVQLHVSEPDACPLFLPYPTLQGPASETFVMRGAIAGERSRTVSEVEYVVKSGDPTTRIQRAFVLLRFRPGTVPATNIAALVAQRFPVDREPVRTLGPPLPPPPEACKWADLPLAMAGRGSTGSASSPSAYGGDTGSSTGGEWWPQEATACRGPERAWGPAEPAHAQGGTDADDAYYQQLPPPTPRITTAEELAIQNYGRPIVIRTTQRMRKMMPSWSSTGGHPSASGSKDVERAQTRGGGHSYLSSSEVPMYDLY